jgi:hypothetical protein
MPKFQEQHMLDHVSAECMLEVGACRREQIKSKPLLQT